MADKQKYYDGYQISQEALEQAIKNETKSQNVTVKSFERSGGSNKGENFTCVMIAIEVTALVDGQEKCFHYMAKCLPANAFRAKFITEINGFSRECYVYDKLMKSYQTLRLQRGLKELRIPKVLLTDEQAGLIIMENLKHKGLGMLNRIKGEVMSFDLASQVLQEIASFHATGYHFLQTYHPNQVEGFLKDQPGFNTSGWLGDEGSETKNRFDQNLQNMAAGIHALVLAHGNDPELADRMEKFLPNTALVIDNCTASKAHYKFQTLNHNDLHINNVMYKKSEDGEEGTDVTLLDLQLMKYSRPTVDLAYFFGSSTYPSFRQMHLEELLKIYHQTLTQELTTFGYSPQSDLVQYTFEDLKDDFEDTWGFGFALACLHIQIVTMDFDSPDGYDPEKITDEKAEREMMEKMASLQIQRAAQNKPYLANVLAMVNEAAEKNII